MKEQMKSFRGKVKKQGGERFKVGSIIYTSASKRLSYEDGDL